MHDYNPNMPRKYPCVVTVQQTYTSAIDEMGCDYNESDEDGLLGVIGESRTSMVLHSASDVPDGYEVIDFDEDEPIEDYE